MNTKRAVATPRWWMTAVTLAIVLAASTPSAQARDPGINQPGAAGNVGGSARQTRVGADPGINQPGAAGNVGRDPGRNQPGAAGNRRP